MNIEKIKRNHSEIDWYPNSNLKAYLWQLKGVMGDHFSLLTGAAKRVVDVGAADGDLSFYLQDLGCQVTAIDNPATNYNDCKALQFMKEELRSGVDIVYQDIDWGFKLEDQYDLAVACGLLYHLRNPMLLLIELAMHAEYLVLSTRTAHHLPDGQDISEQAVAYLLAHDESFYKDSTNYWIFSPCGLQRVLKRTGWQVVNTMSHGAGDESDPVVNDQRTFVFCRRVANWQDLKVHHEF